MRLTTQIISGLSLTLAVTLMTACTSPSATESDFGNSVRHMKQAQTMNPGTPSRETLETSDGDRLSTVLDVYRSDVARPEVIQEDIVIGTNN
jgi:hypothetical protein